MSKMAGYVLSWSLYWIGDFVSKFFCRFDFIAYWLYPIYSFCMRHSDSIQEQTGCDGPWHVK